MLMDMKSVLRFPAVLASALATLVVLGLSFSSAPALAVALPQTSVPIAPAAATGLKAKVGATSATLSWTAVAGADRYVVCLMTSGTATTCVKSTSTTSAALALTGLKPTGGTDYFYTVEAYNSTAYSTSVKASFNLVTPVKFASYNTCAEFCPTLTAWNTRVKAVVAQIKSTSPDVVTVQEAGTIGTHMPILDAAMTGYTRVAGAKSRYIYFRSATMAKTGTTGAALSSGTFTVQATTTSKLTYVPFAALRQVSTGAVVIVADMHLTSLDAASSDNSRLAEMQQTVAKIKPTQTKYPEAGTVFAGDFNSLNRRHIAPYESDLNRYRVAEYLKTLLYVDAVTMAETKVGAEQSSHNPEPGDVRNFGPAFHLDHFFIKAGTRVSTWSLLNRDVPFTSQNSDHDPIFMTAYLPVG